MPHGALILAQVTDGTDRSDQLLADILPWLILLVGVVVAGGIVIYMMRRYLTSDAGQSGDGFTLHDLRQLHAAGELSDEEFEKARAAMIGRLKSSTPAKPSSGNGSRANSGGSSGGPPNNQRTDTEHD